MLKQQLTLRNGKAIAKSKKQNGYWPNEGPNRWKNNAWIHSIRAKIYNYPIDDGSENKK